MNEGRTMRASQLLGREAVDIDSGTSAGVVRDLLLTRAGQLVCAGIQPAEWYAPGLACPPEAIIAASRGRLLYGGCGTLRQLRPARGRRSSLWSFLVLKPLVSRTGDLLGTLEDLVFELPSGRLLSALVSQEHGPLEEFRVSRLTASGPDCVIAELWSPDGPCEVAAEAGGQAEAANQSTEPALTEPVMFDEAGEVLAEGAGDRVADAAPAVFAPVDSVDPAGQIQGGAGGECELVPATETVATSAGLMPVGPMAESYPQGALQSRATSLAQPLLPRQPSPDELNARLAEMIKATAATTEGGDASAAFLPQEAAAGEPGSEATSFGADLQTGPFQPLEALVEQREARARHHLPEAGLTAEVGLPQLFADSQIRDCLDQLRPFDQRKVLFLTGRSATRDIYSPAGPLLARRGEMLTRPVLARIIEAGELDSVFLEHAAVTR